MSDSNGEAPSPQGGVLSVLKRLDDGLSVVERQLLGWSIVIMAVNTVANVIMRLGFSSSIFFSEELNQFLIILVTFVGISEAASSRWAQPPFCFFWHGTPSAMFHP